MSKAQEAAASMTEDGNGKGTDAGAQNGGGAAVDPAKLTVSDLFGQAVWLLTQSPAHRNFFLSDLEWMVMPPVLLRQFRLFPGKNQPIGIALWARLSEEAEARLLQGGGRLAPKDWNSGDRHWLVELIAPFGHQQTMLDDMKRSVFKGKTFKMHAVNADGQRQVVTVAGEGAEAPEDGAKGPGETPKPPLN